METQDKSILGNGRLQKLPIGIQEFSKLRREHYLYVDKTKQIYNFINSAVACFLSRPRRFGKSLLASTLESLFRGERDLFKGLYIEDKWDWTKTYNVIRIDFTKVTKLTPAKLEQSLALKLDKAAKDNGITLISQDASDKFAELIEQLYEKTGKKVVVLIDEYDKPILDRLKAMKETEISIANKDILGDFYGVLKGQSLYLRFIFITGITKFSGVSIFSGLNNLMDLTLIDEFADLCGYTQKELEENFKPYIEALSTKNKRSCEEELNEIKLWYNGYTWDGETAIYNPFSTLQLFVTGKFETYWFDSGSPTFLIDYIKNSVVGTDQVFENESFSKVELMNFNPDRTTTTALLFQTGYLTIRKKIEITLELDEGMIETADEYLLAMPNREVRRAFAQHILLSYVDESEMKRIISTRTSFVKAIKQNDFELLSQTIKDVIEQVPTCLHNNNESYYHSILLAGMAAIGFKVRAEVTAGMGRADIVWKFGKNRVIIEMKYLKSEEKKPSPKEKAAQEKAIREKLNKLAEQAVNQIKEKKYYADYKNNPEIKIILVGVAVDGKDKIVETKIEIV